MGNRKNFNIFIFLVLLLALMMSFTYPSRLHETEPTAAPSMAPSAKYQKFDVKNSKPFFLNKRGRQNKKEKGLNRNKMKKKKIKNFNAKPFLVMLPKGFVPPSGSSPCHNLYPNSVTFFCDLSTNRRP
ncbi:uncharacterized protein LOC111397695 [Olea europaea var. sylvestris]|uniref:uncharacterized protein LOC111397695 n=1 Tax=Olea europaea var. sylvestris TaxID=158386 RepID=UPI000C1CF75B|nr:uncharacterized protein LOC111397695 [Olea europaea var. sylvestris]